MSGKAVTHTALDLLQNKFDYSELRDGPAVLRSAHTGCSLNFQRPLWGHQPEPGCQWVFMMEEGRQQISKISHISTTC